MISWTALGTLKLRPEQCFCTLVQQAKPSLVVRVRFIHFPVTVATVDGASQWPTDFVESCHVEEYRAVRDQISRQSVSADDA